MVRYHARVLWILILLFALFLVHDAWAGAPSDQLSDGVDRAFKIIRDPALAGEEKASQRRAAIVKVAGEIFDFGEMAKRSLGSHWGQRTPAERGDFVRLFTEVIQRSYISRVDQRGSDKMVVRGETVDGDHAVVRTALLLSGGELPLDYRMHNTGGRWQVYDLNIDGISLVANYRAQFNKIIRTSSYEALTAKLGSRQSEFSAPSGARSGGKAAQ
jgi:phospholipid transport system substrate-binding protein